MMISVRDDEAAGSSPATPIYKNDRSKGPVIFVCEKDGTRTGGAARPDRERNPPGMAD
jgi:hypothetical protein